MARYSRISIRPWLVAALALLAVGAGPDSIVAGFDKAVARLKDRGSSIAGTAKPPRIGLEEFLIEADAMVGDHGKAAQGIARSKLTSSERNEGTLAFLILATLARDDAALTTDFTERVLNSPFAKHDNGLYLTHAPASTALAMADRWVAEHGDNSLALAHASALYRFFGDPPRAEDLEARLARLPEEDWYSPTTRADLIALRQRLALAPEERPDWVDQDLLAWRAVRSLPDNISIDANLRTVVHLACRQRRFTAGYLRERLRSKELESLEYRFLTMVVGLQRETAVVPELAGIVDSGRRFWGYAFDALLSIGTRDALARVEGFIRPPMMPIPIPKPAVPPARTGMDPAKRDAEERRSLVEMYCEALARCGDRKSLDVLRALVKNKDYPPDERAAFGQARDALHHRLVRGG